MKLRASWVALRMHQFEATVVIAGAAMVVALGLSISFRLDALGLDARCLDATRRSADGTGVGATCLAAAREGASVLGEVFLTGEGTLALSVMGLLPFVIGLVAGTPIVAREIELSTAQMAWSLSGSRTAWLARQALPLLLVVFGVSLVAGIVASGVAEWAALFGRSGFAMIGLHGPAVALRALAATALGLFVGAVVGRTLPAFLIGASLCVGLMLLLGGAKAAWISSLDPQLIGVYSEEHGGYEVEPRAITTSWGVVAPDGTLLSSAEARGRATKAGVPESDDIQDLPALQWYEENGYHLAPMGVREAEALRWAPYEAVAFPVVAVVGFAGAAAAIRSRRPV